MSDQSTPAHMRPDLVCPRCKEQGLDGMIAQDQFGLFCLVRGCGWTGEEETE